MNGNSQLIGLIGGVGPWAGWDVHRKILEESAYEREQDCVSVMHLSFPGKYTDRTDYLLGKTRVNPAHAFLRELRFLENYGAAGAAIVCNTAHADPILDLIEAGMIGSPMRYVNIIRETQAVLKQDRVKRVGLLATLGTYSLDLYRNQFDAEVIYPIKSNQKRVHNIVYNIQNGLKMHYPKCIDELYPELLSVAKTLIADGAEALVLGCTELPLLADFGKYVDVPVYDPNRILAKVLIAQASQPAETKSLSAIYNPS
jgi:aspartate racemase